MFKLSLISILLLNAFSVAAQTVPVPSEVKKENKETQKVEVKGAQTDLEASRDFVAGKLIIGRKQIAESGLQNVNELLKREPAVTIGKDGRISLMGLAGYTQILLNGQPPSGKNPLEMDLSEIERIEIIKSSTAETGPFGIAGTINVISKKVERKAFQQASAGVQGGAGTYGVNAAWSINEASPNDPWSWNLRINSSQRPNLAAQKMHQAQYDNKLQLLSEFDSRTNSKSDLNFTSVSSDLVYRPNKVDEFSFSPAFGGFKSDTESVEQRLYTKGLRWDIDRRTNSTMQGIDFPFAWKRDVDEEGRLKLDLRLSNNQLKNQSRILNLIQMQSADVQSSESRDDTNSVHLNFEHERSFDGGHDVKMGLRWSKFNKNSEYLYKRNADVDTRLMMFGQSSHVEEEKRRVFIQDDWRINRQWAINVGVSGEQRVYDMKEASLLSVSNFQVWSPSFHLAKKIQGDTKRQLRFSIARNFQAPEVNDLMLRPSINSLAPCLSYSTCPTNTLDTSDSMGNPKLQAERAWAVNASYEHGLSADSQVTFEVYSRTIDNKVGNEISLQSVPWSNQPRYVYRPANLGSADVFGASVDWKIALRDWWKTAPKIDVRGSVSRAHSRVSDLPAPYNRLEGQLPWRAKLGMAYALADLPLRINLDANWLPGDWIRNNQTQLSYESRLVSYSANAVWTPSKTMSVSFNLTNLFAPNRLGIKEYRSRDSFIQNRIEKSSYTQLGVRLEMKL